MKSRTITLLIIIGLPWSIWLMFYGSCEDEMMNHEAVNQGRTVTKEPTGRSDNDVAEQEKIQDNANKLSSPLKKDDKPLFILHVGPPKTGTTTVQWAAARHEDLLLQDGIHFLGHYGHDSDKRPEWKLHDLVWSCTQGKEEKCQEKWSNLNHTVETLYQKQQQNDDAPTIAFLSEELFSHYKNELDEEEHLWKYIVPLLDKWHVRIVMTYRRFYEWAPSYYAQLNAPKDKKKRREWPNSGHGGQPIPTFPEYFEDVMEMHYNRLLNLKQKWAKHFPDVWVFNMHGGHQDGDYEEKFFCQMLPEAKQLCHEFQKQETKLLLKNPSSTKILHHDMIAVEAQQEGLVHGSLSRAQARQAVQDHATQTLGLTQLSDFPNICLSHEQLDKVVQWSMTLEQQMVPTFFNSKRGKPEIQSEIANYIQNTDKFCSVNAKAVVKQKKWRDFFKTLRADKGK